MPPQLRKRKAKEPPVEPAPESAKKPKKAAKKAPKEEKDISEYYYRKPKYKPWPKQEPPITEIEKVPESLDWNADDNDLDDKYVHKDIWQNFLN